MAGEDWRSRYGWCNACGEEAPLDGECEDPDCIDGEVVPYDEEDE